MNTNHNITAVIFDLFGTLVDFGVHHHPFRQLLKWARENGRHVRPDDARTVMTINGGLEAIAHGLKIAPPPDLLQKLQEEISEELESLALFDDVIPVLRDLQSQGLGIGISSNLAQPYGRAIQNLLAEFDFELFLSYKLAAIKPDIQMYESILTRFNCAANKCLFIGDTHEADYAGPIGVGMKALHLMRSGATLPQHIGSLNEVLRFLGKHTRDEYDA